MTKTQLIATCLALVIARTTFASGSSPARPPRPPSPRVEAERIDDAKYAEGKAVFTGKAQLTKNPKAAKSQRARLEILAGESGAAGAKLPALAGKLSAEQLDALDYYVAYRYGGRATRR